MHARQPTGFAGVLRSGERLVFLFVLVLQLFAGACLAASNVVDYSRDAAGNITGIVRQAPTGLAITGFDPAIGPVGTSVTIYGAGFSATASNNAIAFNGTAVTASTATSGSLTTVVPAGATVGRITVTVGASTATSAQDFVVTGAGAPTITAFSPPSGSAGATVTVTGSNFDTAPGATSVKVNGVSAGATVTSSTGLSFPIPASAASGKITVITSAGTATSAGDLIVPPAGISAADIVVSRRISVDGASGNVALATTNKHAMVLFDALASGFYSVQFGAFATSPTSATVNYKVMNPDNTVLLTGTVGNAARPSLHLPRLATTGTYSVLLSPGIATLNTNVRVATNPALLVDGTAHASSLDAAYQSARFVFDAAAGQRIGLGGLGLAFSPPSATPPMELRIYKPDGVLLFSAACQGVLAGNPQGNCDGEIVATVAGTYSVVAESPLSGFGNLSVQLSGEASGALAPDVTQDVITSRVGQDARYTFTASVADSFGVDLSGAALQPPGQGVMVSVVKPDGAILRTCSLAPPAPGYCELGTLATAGTYSVQLDPAYGAYGSLKLTLKQGAVLSPVDPPSAFAPSAVPESARFRFTASAGQNLTVGVVDLAYVGTGSVSTLTVYRPDRSTQGSAQCSPTTAGGRCKLTLANLAAGTYSVVLTPPAGVNVSGSVNLSNDITGSLIAGTPQAVNAARAGQNARFTFSGTAGESTSVKLYGVATTPAAQSVSLWVYSPTGASLATSSIGSSGSGLVNLPSLPVSGTYTAVADSTYGITWQGQIALDPGALVTVNGAAASLATTTAGEMLRYRVAGTAGQRLEFGLAGLAYGAASANATTFTLYRPDGLSAMSATCTTSGIGNCETFVASLPVTGTYSAVFTPPPSSSITGGALHFSTPVTGTLVVGDPAQTISISRAGQTARYTFAGTAAQLLRLNWSGTTVQGVASVAASVLKPDGSTLSSGSFTNAATGGIDIASLPTTGTYTVVFDPSLASTMSAPATLVIR